MSVTSGSFIVARALDLATQYPRMAAVHILDSVMHGHQGEVIDFRAASGAAYDDWLDPPSPFAELLRRAFGGHLPLRDVDCQSPAWEFDVIEAFSDRYDVVPAGIDPGDEPLMNFQEPPRPGNREPAESLADIH